MIKSIWFALRCLTIEQILWTILKILGVDLYVMGIGRFLLIAKINSTSFDTRILNSSDELDKYGSIFYGNKLCSSNVWEFNNANFNIDSDFLYSPLAKYNYTHRMVFMHFEWVFATKNGAELAKHFDLSLSDAELFNHPSCMSQRVYVYLWLAKSSEDEFFKNRLLFMFKSLILHTEESVRSNHLLDNLLAICALSILFKNLKIFRWSINRLQSLLCEYRRYGVFPEKTPCYQALIASRVGVCISFISTNSDNYKYKIIGLKTLVGLKQILISAPQIHLNDSYLPLKNWAEVLTGSSEYSVSIDGPNNIKAVLVCDASPFRGYTGHAHDSTGSAFLINVKNGFQYIGGLGTPTYQNSELRNAARASNSYFIPLPVLNYRARLKPLLSFRNDRLLKQQSYLSTMSLNEAILLIADDSNKYFYEINMRKFDNGFSFNFSSSELSVITFWSDVNVEKFSDVYKFRGDIKSKIIQKGSRYDGIFNEIQCTKCTLEFFKSIEIFVEIN
jgi:hypothetical protein